MKEVGCILEKLADLKSDLADINNSINNNYYKFNTNTSNSLLC
jgi:hypothetical protein